MSTENPPPTVQDMQRAVDEALRLLEMAQVTWYDDKRMHAILDEVEGALFPFASSPTPAP